MSKRKHKPPAALKSISIGDALHLERGEVLVLVTLNREDNSAELIPMTPEYAETIAGELLRWATAVRGDSTIPDDWHNQAN